MIHTVQGELPSSLSATLNTVGRKSSLQPFLPYLVSIHFHASLSGVTPETGRWDFCRPLWYRHGGNRTPAQQMTTAAGLHQDVDTVTLFFCWFWLPYFQKDTQVFSVALFRMAFTGTHRRRHPDSESPHPPNIPQPCKMPTCTHPFTSEKSLSSSLTGHQARNWPQPYFIWMNGKTEEGTKASMCSTASLKHALSFPPPQRAQLQCN